jgi:hypothetical protein
MSIARQPWLVRFALPIAVGAGALGCSFEAASGGATLTSNTCSSDSDCVLEARCAEAMCVARDVDGSLRVVLEVTPAQQPDGLPPVPFTIDDLTVESGRMFRDWEQSEPVLVRGRLRNGPSIVEAEVTLTATESAPGLLPKVATMSVRSASDSDGYFDYELRVAEVGEYTLRVQPKDTSLPPLERLVTVENGDEIDIDYGDPNDVEITTLAVTLNGATDERPLVVRAFDSLTGALISSAAPVTMGTAELRFAGKPESYRLVVRPEGAYDPDGLSSGANCDHDTPVLPTLSIELNNDDIDKDSVTLDLPIVPERVPYQGSIVLCDAPVSDNAMPVSLPVTLRSITVLLEDALGAWTAEVATDTEATLDEGFYRFCVDVFQGTYDVVITPPASLPCEILAEERPVGRQVVDDKATGAEFKMTSAAELAGQVLTGGTTALASAVVDVQSLGREGAVEFAPELPTLTGYNRSQQTTTDASGAFSLSVDRGSYDVTFKPPPGSGYAWYVLRDVTIGSQMRFTNTIDMSSPVAIDYSISYSSGNASLAGAEITAYAVVNDATRVDRAIPIGKAVADEDGNFMLLLPSEVPDGW